MERTQILVHRWEAQNKDFGAVLKNDLTIIQFRLWRRLDTSYNPGQKGLGHLPFFT